MSAPEPKIAQISNRLMSGNFGASPSAFLIDRDGVINEHRPGRYVNDWPDFSFLPGTFDAFRALASTPDPVIVVTNQSGVGRGVMSASALEDIHERMVGAVTSSGGGLMPSFTARIRLPSAVRAGNRNLECSFRWLLGSGSRSHTPSSSETRSPILRRVLQQDAGPYSSALAKASARLRHSPAWRRLTMARHFKLHHMYPWQGSQGSPETLALRSRTCSLGGAGCAGDQTQSIGRVSADTQSGQTLDMCNTVHHVIESTGDIIGDSARKFLVPKPRGCENRLHPHLGRAKDVAMHVVTNKYRA